MSERNLEIDSGWLIERDPNGGDFYEGHMLPGSDCTPLVDLSTLPGWMVFSEEAIERAVEVLLERWPGWCECRRSPFDKHNVNPPCNTRVKANAQARAVVAALRGEA
jgi:hypothetical protein